VREKENEEKEGEEFSHFVRHKKRKTGCPWEKEKGMGGGSGSCKRREEERGRRRGKPRNQNKKETRKLKRREECSTARKQMSH
jgi:hypothetical protein